MSKQQLQTTTHRNATGTGAATSTGYVAPDKSTVIPIRPYKYDDDEDDDEDDDDEDDVDIDDIPLLSLASSSPSAAAATKTSSSSSSASDRRNRKSNRNNKSKSKSTNADADDTRNNTHQHPVAPAYTMIELNGILLPPIEFPPMDTCQSIFGTDQRVELGKFYMSGPDQKIPTLILGSHQVKGKVKKLKSSFCLMEKRYKNATATSTAFSSEPPVPLPPPNKKQKLQQQPQPKKKQIECYQIIGIVTEKIIFDTYPKVIMRKMI